MFRSSSPSQLATFVISQIASRERRGGRQRRAGRVGTNTPIQPAATLGVPATVLVDSERARPSRLSPDPASTAGTRSAAVVAGCRAAEGFRVSSPALGVRHRYSKTGYSSRRRSNCVTYGLFSQLRCGLIVVISVRASLGLRCPFRA